jgi:hypothetical protein
LIVWIDEQHLQIEFLRVTQLPSGGELVCAFDQLARRIGVRKKALISNKGR